MFKATPVPRRVSAAPARKPRKTAQPQHPISAQRRLAPSCLNGPGTAGSAAFQIGDVPNSHENSIALMRQAQQVRRKNRLKSAGPRDYSDEIKCMANF
jgi:hypothetical protein